MSREASVPKAWAGTLTVRTDNDTGTVTITDSSHLITTGARGDVYWSGGVRREVTVGTVSGTVVPIDLGAGDNLPAAVKVAVAQVYDFLFDGNDLLGTAFSFTATPGVRGVFVLTLSSNAEQYYALDTSGGMTLWTSEDGVANPVVGDAIAKLFLSHEDTTAPRTMSSLVGVT